MTRVTDKSKKIPENIQPPSVAIIGAGMAGLSAAVRLLKAGINNITILEANNKPGGRIKCVQFGKSLLEFGADTIEGACMANPVYNLAALENLFIRCTGCRKQYYLTTSGETYLENFNAKMLMRNLLTEASGYFAKPNECLDISLDEFLYQRIEESIKQFKAKDRQPIEVALLGLANSMRGRIGEDLQSISLKNFGSYIDIPGGNIRIPRGMISLIAALTREIPASKMFFNRAVQNIRFTPFSVDTPRALIKCCDGEEFLADYVICTVSLGVLKSSADLLFLPSLPPEKLDAIKTLGFGQITKLFLEYDKPFWAKGERSNFLLALNKSDKVNKDEWMKGITSIEVLPGRQNILKVTVAGKEANWVEQLKRGMIGEELTNFLRRVSGDMSLPCPKELLISKWSTDLNFLGARSYLGLGSNVKHQCALASPVPGKCEEGPPILLFAGEATSPGHYGTMHGARISGIREADRIIDLTLELQGPPKRLNVKPQKQQTVPCYCPPRIKVKESCIPTQKD
ncbi:peroxisomal N(1)-acetyl-spermine/spermidine oxidase-like isoform X2 [Cimex lectularius]|nr:peroxisomal N(1)-acetyl-spermine/spermidine oxidase-like isoform X2 [Cimex lectularius]